MTRRLPSPHRSPGRALIAASLSALLPGLGQWYAGDRRKALIHLTVSALFVVPAAVLLLLVFYVTGLDLALDISRPFFRNPDLLLLLLAANIVLVGFRAASAMDAFVLMSAPRLVRGRPPLPVIAAIGGLVLVMILTLLPHVWVGHRNVALYDLLSHDFLTDPGQAATTTTIPVTTTSEPGTTSSTTTTTSMPTTTTTLPPFAGEERVNILLLGSDAGIGRVGIRTDTMIIVSVDPETGWTSMFSIPRNFIKLPIPEGHPARPLWPDGAWGDPSNLAWGVYAYGQQNPDLFDGENTGGDAAKTIYGNTLGLDIDFFAMVDLQGFVDIVDALGGVEITVTSRIVENNYTHPDGTTTSVTLEPGTYHMDGQTALVFSRGRSQSNDFVRMGRQRCVLEAIARQADPVTLLRELPTLVPAIQSSVITDIPMGLIPDFLDLLRKVDTTDILSMRFMPNAPEFAGTPTSYVAYRIEGYNVPNLDLIRERVQIAITLPPDEARVALSLQPLVEECGVAGSADDVG